MYMLIRYPIGIIVEAVVLAKGKNRIRAAAAGFPDVIELKRSGPQWFTATGQPVDFDFLMFDAHTGVDVSFSKPVSATAVAASAAVH